ncbi:MAG: hypothetical protein ACYDBB_06380 [Armatimonadota bacterium]
MATKIKGFLAGTSYAPSVSTDEALLRQGCGAIQDARISSTVVVLEDGTLMVGYPTFLLTTVMPDLVTGIIRERLLQDDFASRTVRSEIRARLREIEGKSDREQSRLLAKLLQDYAEYFLVEAGTDMDDAARREEARLDAQCKTRAA